MQVTKKKLLIILFTFYFFHCKEELKQNEIDMPKSEEIKKVESSPSSLSSDEKEKLDLDSNKVYYTVANIQSSLIVREEPTKDAKSVGQLKDNARVEWLEDSPSEETIYGLTNNWKKIKFEEDGVAKEGWSFGAFLKPEGEKKYSPKEAYFYIVKGHCTSDKYTREEGCLMRFFRSKDFRLLTSLGDSDGAIDDWLSDSIIHFRVSIGDGGCDSSRESMLDLNEVTPEIKEFLNTNSCIDHKSDPLDLETVFYDTKTVEGSCSVNMKKKMQLVEISCFNTQKKIKSTSLSVKFPEIELNLKPMEIELDSGTYSLNIRNGTFRKF